MRLAISRWRACVGVVVVVAMMVACDSDSPTEPGGVNVYAQTFGWTCAALTNCQDVFDFELEAGSTLSITVNQVADGSASQLALYGPGVALGGTNMLTGTANELRCLDVDDCHGYTTGVAAPNVVIAQAGRYRLAVTRHWGQSCGGTGTYNLSITSTMAFVVHGQTAEDQPSLAPGSECG